MKYKSKSPSIVHVGSPSFKALFAPESEHDLQARCVAWFAKKYPDMVLFAIPNAGKRKKTTGYRLRDEGMKAGVADLFLAYPSGPFHGIFLEAKFGHCTQSKPQKEFEQAVIKRGYRYQIFYTEDEFKTIIKTYIHD